MELIGGNGQGEGATRYFVEVTVKLVTSKPMRTGEGMRFVPVGEQTIVANGADNDILTAVAMAMGAAQTCKKLSAALEELAAVSDEETIEKPR